MLAQLVNLPFKVLGRAARAVQAREAARRAQAEDGPGAHSAAVQERRSPLDVPEDFHPGELLLSVADLAHAVQAERAPNLVDVRSRAEHAQGHIAGSFCMPEAAIHMELAEIPAGRIVVYGDRGGRHARKVVCFLRYRGLDDAWVLDGGFPAWKAAGHPVTT